MRHSTLRSARTTCAVLAVLALTALSFRLWRASTLGLGELLGAATTTVLLISAGITGWRLHVGKLRAEQQAERAEWEDALRRRPETLLDGDEDRALWDSVPALGSEHDTCAFGTQVVVLDQRRRNWGQQAG